MAAEGPGDLLVPDLRTIEELSQPSLNGRGGPITSIAIQALNFRLKNDMIQQVKNSCQFHGLPSNDANKHLDKFLHVTQSIKVNGVTDDSLRLYLFPHSLTHHATSWFDHLPMNSINTFEQMAKMFLGKYFPPSMVTTLRNEIINFHQRPDESLFKAWERYKLSIDRCPNHNILPVTQIDTFYNGLTLRHRDTINAAAGGTFMKRHLKECYDLNENMTAHHNDWDTSAQWSESSSSITFSSDTEIAALRAEMAEINKNLMRVLQPPLATLRTYQPQDNRNLLRYHSDNYLGPPGFNQNQNRNNQNHNFHKQNRNQGNHHPQGNNQGRNQFFQGANQGNTITNLKEDLKGITTRSGTTYQGPMIPTSSFLPPIVELISTIIEPVASPVSAPKPNHRPSISYPSRLHDQKLRDKANDQREKFFQIFKDLNFNISFADALILMLKFGPSIKSLLTKNDKLCELARTPLNEHCSAVILKKLIEKLGDPNKFLIPCDFSRTAECLALADLDASINLMPLSVWNKLFLLDLSPMCMTLKLTDRLISRPVGVAEDVFVKVGTFHFPTDFVVVDLDVNPRVPLILGRSFLKTRRALIDVFEVIASSNPTPYYEPIVSTTSPTLTPFRNSDFLLEEVDAFLALEDDPTLSEVDQSYVDTEGDILLLDIFLNDDPSLSPLNQGNYLLQVRKELKICEAKFDKSLIDEPPEVKLKDLPPHLEYAFLEGDEKLTVIIAKDLSEDFEPAVQHQRRVNPKIHNVIKNEVLKLLDAGFIYPISDSPCRCMMAIFHDMIEKTIEVFMDDFSVFGNSFQTSLSHLEKMLKRCEDTNLCLNWEKSHFLVKESIVLGHKISKERIEVDKAKVDVIAKLPHPTTVKVIRSFLGYAGFYRRFIKDFSKIAWPMTHLLEKDTPFHFSKECVEAFQTLKRKLAEALILISPDWDMPFEHMCDASDFAIGAVLRQRQDKHFRPIHYASRP
nr:reverse transcriptase domain-containing protein [Tanacetum cinerariifolium]